ncbi:MAG: glycolate oxidase subunit GlcE [Acetobacteraceae bacterium]|nr:glycolate oxidase subunit GlcE [Acetobacteraceae bacterium]MCX7684545.1 glycolate oxidase subunit GlcE [Acetobacteraceae bacterium]MDW8398025.1 glycolate oxidase subunit GlcE [Acetobacteraceae bacterium]
MSAPLAPAEEAGVAAAVAEAFAANAPLAVEGAGTKRAMLRPVQAARTLSTRALAGITLYRPKELVIAARAGTPLAEVEAALAAEGQMLIAEPPSAAPWGGGAATLGGVVAANLSGPRRISGGAMRDHVLGIRFVNGRGEVLRSGGRVLKNVTGLDLCKLLAGSHGTLGVLTEITLKVLPRPETAATLVIRVADAAAGVRALSAGLGSPFGVSGAAVLPDAAEGPLALLRIEDFASFVAYRIGRLRDLLLPFGESRIADAAETDALWAAIRDGAPLAAGPEEALWRASVKPTDGPRVLAALREAGLRGYLDWGGGLVWIAGPATAAAHAAVTAAASPGSFTLLRAPDALRAAVPVIPEEPPPLAALSRRVKAALDPKGILNPGRMRAGL